MGDRGTGGGTRERLTRRAVLAGAAVTAATMVVAPASPNSGATRGTPPAGTPSTPEATATPRPTPSPTPNPTGELEVVRERRPSDGEPVRGGTIRLLRPGSAETVFDFSPVTFRQDFQVAASYLDPLLRPDPATLEPRPWLAEGWTWSEGDRVVTYDLRQDVRWHDGTPITAADVVFSFVAYRDDFDSGVRNLFALMEDAVAVDDHTVRVTLVEPDGGWLPNASTLPIFQAEQYRDFWQERPVGERTLSGYDWARRAPVGTGPWTVATRTAAGVELERNAAYWAGPPYAATLVVGWEPDGDRRIDAWRRGEIDLLWPLAPGDLTRVNRRPGVLHVADAASVIFAAFNFDNPARAVPDLFADVRVRRAMSLAVDRRRYATDVFRGFLRHEAAGTIAQPWLRDDGLVNPPRDLETARELLADAGWEDRDGDGVLENPAGLRFAVTAITRHDSRAELLPLLQRVVRDLEEVGIDLVVKPLPPDQFRERWTTTRDFDLIAYAYDLYPGFTDFDLYGSGWDIRANPQGWNPGGYRNDSVDAAVADALVAADFDDLRDALVRLQRAADEDLFALWLGFSQDLVLVRPEVRGFQSNMHWQTMDTRLLWRSG